VKFATIVSNQNPLIPAKAGIQMEKRRYPDRISPFAGASGTRLSRSVHFDNLDPVRTLSYQIALRLAELAARLIDPID